MKIKLIQGEYNSQEALELISAFVKVKIDFHERKINLSDSEEDIKQRENRIKELHHNLDDWKQLINDSKNPVYLESMLYIDE